MLTLTKHRDEAEAFQFDFTNLLGTNETISSITAVKIVRRSTAAGGWTDVSAQFGSPAGSIVTGEKKIQFTLAAATGSQQAAGMYVLYGEVVTSDAETLVQTGNLTVSDRASLTA